MNIGIIIIIICSSVRVIIITSPYGTSTPTYSIIAHEQYYTYTVVVMLYLSVTNRAPSTTLAPTATSTAPTVAPTGAVTFTSIYINIYVCTYATYIYS